MFKFLTPGKFFSLILSMAILGNLLAFSAEARIRGPKSENEFGPPIHGADENPDPTFNVGRDTGGGQGDAKAQERSGNESVNPEN